MKIYCMKCNSPTEFSDVKPKFCASCGGQLGKSNSSTSSSRQLPKRKSSRSSVEDEEAYDEDQDSRNFSFGLGKIEIETLDGNLGCVQKLGDLALEHPTEAPKKRTSKAKRVSRKKFESDWRSELTSRDSKEIGGGG